MKLQWLGHACFKISHKDYSIVIDPYDADYVPGYKTLKVKADKVLVSHNHYGHNYKKGVILSGRPESDCPFEITSFEVSHDSIYGRMRGNCLVHILEADGLKIAHMGDIGTQLNGGEITQLFGVDALMVGAGSMRALPSPEIFRMTEELYPKAIIPMHYHDGPRGYKRLEPLDNLVKQYQSPEMIHWYDTDTIEINENTEPQVAVLKFFGGRNGDFT